MYICKRFFIYIYIGRCEITRAARARAKRAAVWFAPRRAPYARRLDHIPHHRRVFVLGAKSKWGIITSSLSLSPLSPCLPRTPTP